MYTHNIVLINHQSSMALATSATSIAAAKNLAIVACVVDVTGRVKTKVIMDGAPVIADDFVERKARTALFGMSSGDFGQAVREDVTSLHSFSAHPNLTLLAGGIPLFHEGVLVGSFAVAGAMPEQDALVARVAVTENKWLVADL